MSDRQLFGLWVRSTWIGWVLGVPLIIALALIGEAVGIGGAQVLVGAGIGVGIGLMQGRALRGMLNQAVPWFWSCVVGLAVPFLATDVAKAGGLVFPYSLYASVALGGTIVGAWQAFLLRPRPNTGWWVVWGACLDGPWPRDRQPSRTFSSARIHSGGSGALPRIWELSPWADLSWAWSPAIACSRAAS